MKLAPPSVWFLRLWRFERWRGKHSSSPGRNEIRRLEAAERVQPKVPKNDMKRQYEINILAAEFSKNLTNINPNSLPAKSSHEPSRIDENHLWTSPRMPDTDFTSFLHILLSTTKVPCHPWLVLVLSSNPSSVTVLIMLWKAVILEHFFKNKVHQVSVSASVSVSHSCMPAWMSEFSWKGTSKYASSIAIHIPSCFPSSNINYAKERKA